MCAMRRDRSARRMAAPTVTEGIGMKRNISAVLVAASALLLAACASGGGTTRAAPQAYLGSEKVVENAEYVAMVERVARRRGVNVHWFNPPTVRVDATDELSAEAE